MNVNMKVAEQLVKQINENPASQIVYLALTRPEALLLTAILDRLRKVQP